MKNKLSIIIAFGTILFLTPITSNIYSADDFIISDTGLSNPFKPQLPLPKPAPVKTPDEQQQPKADPKKSGVATVPKPAPEQQATLPTLTITGLVWNSDRPQAIINGAVVDIGDTVASVKVIAIRKESVDVLFQDKKITIQP